MAKVAYSERYTGSGLKVIPKALPKFKHTNGMKVEEMYIREAGTLSDGREYQILRVVFAKEGR